MAQAQIARPGGTRTEASRIGSSGPIDRVFQGTVTGIGALVIVVLIGLIALLVVDSWPAIQRYGFDFITTSTWDPVKEQFGIWPFVYGTLFSSALGLLIATPIAV